MSSNGPQKPPHIREFTPRSVAVGLLVALIIGASYPYMVLKFGFGPNISVVSAFFGFVALGLFSKSYNRWENNIVQTAGTSAAQVAFLCWLLAAFDLLRLEPGSGFDVNLTTFQTWAWLIGVGAARRVPGGAAAQALHRRREPAVPRRHRRRRDADRARRARAAGAQVGVCDDGRARRRRASSSWRRCCSGSATRFRSIVNDFSARVGLGFGVSLLSIGSGIIIGLRISASMLIGGILAWVLMPPWLLSQGLLAADGRRVDILLLVMWPSVGLLVAGGMCALLLRWRVLMATFRSLSAADVTTGDLPLRWVVIGGGAVDAVRDRRPVALLRARRCGTRCWRLCCRCRSASWRCACSARPTGARSAP